LDQIINKGQLMTEILLQQLEEKMMTRLSELEGSRRDLDNIKRELDNTKRENAALKVEREKLEERIKGIIALLETVNAPEVAAQAAAVIAKPALLHT
jgi:regulator of replication initiation timing